MWYSIPLTLFWFVYFGSLGIFYPYFALYLRENAGLSGTEVGMILAISPLIGMVAGPFWGRLADRTGARSYLLALLTLGTALGYLGLGIAQGFWSIVLATAALAVVGTAVFPLMTSVSLAILRDAGSHAFGRVRMWGTVGYFILILIFPWLLRVLKSDAAGAAQVAQPGLGLMFPITAGLVLAAALIAFLLPRSGAAGLRAVRGDWRELARNPAFEGRFKIRAGAVNHDCVLASLYPHRMRHPWWNDDRDIVRTAMIVAINKKMHDAAAKTFAHIAQNHLHPALHEKHYVPLFRLVVGCNVRSPREPAP